MINQRKNKDGTVWELSLRPSYQIVGYFTTEKNAHEHATKMGLTKEWDQYVIREVLA